MRRYLKSTYDLSVFDQYTANKIYVALNKKNSLSQKIRILLTKHPIAYKQQTNIVSTILDIIYRQNFYSSNAYPLWMAKFIFTTTNNKKEKINFVKEYRHMLTFQHSVLNLKETSLDKNPPKLIKNYINKWIEEQLEFNSRIECYEPGVEKETENEKLLQLNFQKNKNLSSDVKNLIKVRKQYNLILKNKFRPPELCLNIYPDRFGNPPKPERIFNMILIRLSKLQKYYLKYPPMNHEDMRILDEIDLNSLSGLVREGYVEFLTSSAFSIDNNAIVKKSSILEKRMSISNKVEALYKAFN